MKKNIKLIILLLSLGIILSSCVTFFTATVTYMKPSKLSIPKDIQTIGILTSGNREYRREIYDILFKVFGSEAVKARYNLIDRQNIDRILREQNLYDSDEFNDNNALKLGNLTGADAIIIGGYKNVRENLSHARIVLLRKYPQTYIDDEGKRRTKYIYRTEDVPSIIKTYTFSIEIRMIDISTGRVLHNDREDYMIQYEKYYDNKPENFAGLKSYNVRRQRFVLRNIDFPPMDQILINVGKNYGTEFAKIVAPYMVSERMSFERIFRDKINEKYINFIKAELFDEAKILMEENLDVINSLEKAPDRAMHYYNLACVYEITNDLDKSKKYYTLAVKEDATSLHLAALKAIKDRISDKNKLDTQLEKDDDDDDF